MEAEHGARFGRLTVTGWHTDKRRKWYTCKCECGKSVQIRSDKLAVTQSCGCLRVEKVTKPITDKKFGRLTVIERAGSHGNGLIKYRCKCDCGNVVVVDGYLLRNGTRTTCGRQCGIDMAKKEREQSEARQAMINKRLEKNALRKENPHLLYVWQNMIRRCYSKTHPKYRLYGARCIKVCDDWITFESFCTWALANGYDHSKPAYQCTLDRIDNDGNYEPNNCRWADQYTQQHNKRSNKQQRTAVGAGNVTGPVRGF